MDYFHFLPLKCVQYVSKNLILAISDTESGIQNMLVLGWCFSFKAMFGLPNMNQRILSTDILSCVLCGMTSTFLGKLYNEPISN